MADRHVWQLLFLQKQVAVLGEQEKGDLGGLTRSPFEIGCLAGFEQEGKVEGLLAQERACVFRMAGLAPGVGLTWEEARLLHPETRKW